MTFLSLCILFVVSLISLRRKLNYKWYLQIHILLFKISTLRYILCSFFNVFFPERNLKKFQGFWASTYECQNNVKKQIVRLFGLTKDASSFIQKKFQKCRELFLIFVSNP